MSKYNGWNNYATWRVNLEILDGINVQNHFYAVEKPETSDLADWLKEYCEDAVFSGESNRDSLMGNYAQAFLNDVDWWELAEHFLSDWEEEDEE